MTTLSRTRESHADAVFLIDSKLITYYSAKTITTSGKTVAVAEILGKFTSLHITVIDKTGVTFIKTPALLCR